MAGKPRESVRAVPEIRQEEQPPASVRPSALDGRGGTLAGVIRLPREHAPARVPVARTADFEASGMDGHPATKPVYGLGEARQSPCNPTEFYPGKMRAERADVVRAWEKEGRPWGEAGGPQVGLCGRQISQAGNT